MSVEFVLDGAPVSVDVDPKTPTLDVLRDHFGLTSLKAGCSPQGLCGCCTTLIDGKPRLTCTLPVKSVLGKSLVTLSGLSAAERNRIADAFVAAGALQCGYCTPGIVLSTHALLSANSSPSPEDIHRALMPHTCRCTGYVAIAEGIRAAAEGGAPDSGDARRLPLGEAPYVDDLVRDGMWHAAVVFAPVATGVVEEVTAGEGVTIFRGPGETIGHAGDIVAAAVAATPAEARERARAVAIRARPVPVEADLLARASRREGDFDAAWEAAEARAEVELVFAPGDPVFLEPEAALGLPELVYSAAHDGAEVAAACGVRAVLVPSGGSYGGKDFVSVEPIAARLAARHGRPVKLALTHEEGMRLHPKRPGGAVRVELCAAGGVVTGARVRSRLDGGAACVHPERIVSAALQALACEEGAVDFEATVSRSAHPSAGPVRGAGSMPVAVAMDLARARLGVALPAPVSGDGWSVACGRAAGGARVVLTVSGPGEVEVQCNVPDFGVGRDEALLATLAAATGLEPEAFTVAWGDSEVVGSAAEGPVEGAARAAASAMAKTGGPLSAMVGRRFVGEGDVAPAAWSAAKAEVLDGVVTAIEVSVTIGDQDPDRARNVAEGAAHMALGAALSEESASSEGMPETRFRFLGLVREKLTPPIRVRCVPVGGPSRDPSEAVFSSVVAAIVRAVGGDAIPLKTSAAAKAVGVRGPRPG